MQAWESTQSPNRDRFRLGEWIVDTRLDEISRENDVIKLEPRMMRLLARLAEKPGEVVSTEQLLDSVWVGVVVGPASVYQAVSQLRKLLGDVDPAPTYIATVPRKGYRLVATIHQIDIGAPKEQLAAAQTPRQGTRAHRALVLRVLAAALVVIGVAYLLWPQTDALDTSPRASPEAIVANTVAVLPFADLSANRDMGYFTDGMADELMTSLSRVQGIQVIGRHSAFSPAVRTEEAKAIGERLHVENILEGSVRKEGEHLRIVAQLTRTRDGHSLWSDSYDRKLDDVLDLQSKIAEEVAAALTPLIRQQDISLSGRLKSQQARNPDAYAAYLHGVFHYQKREYWLGQDALEKAVKLEPAYAAAHAYLARTYARLSEISPTRSDEFRSLANTEVDKALRLDPQIADVWWIATTIAERASAPTLYRVGMLERALEHNSDDSTLMDELGHAYNVLGRRDDAHRLFERAYRTDPLVVQNIRNLASSTLINFGDRTRVLALADELEQLNPQDPTGGILQSRVAFVEGRALDWDRWTAKNLALGPLYPSAHVAIAWDYANFGLFDAALHHARVCRQIKADEPGWCGLVRVWLLAGNLDAARAVAMKDAREVPNDLRVQLALGDYEYFSGDCGSAQRSIVIGLPQLARPAASLDLGAGEGEVPLYAATLAWCLRKSGDSMRAAELSNQLKIQFANRVPGQWNAIHARMAAATGDLTELKRQLAVMAASPSMRYAFSRREPMMVPYLSDPEVDGLLKRVEARISEWRKLSPMSSVKVQIPGITTN